MLCEAPHPCGKCEPCLSQRKFLWTERAWNEVPLWDRTYFLTLTYRSNPAQQREPAAYLHHSLSRYLARLRRALGPTAILRYFGVREMGTQNGRWHLHLLISGLKPITGRYLKRNWKLGYAHVKKIPLTALDSTVDYVCKYITKADSGRIYASMNYGSLVVLPGCSSLQTAHKNTKLRLTSTNSRVFETALKRKDYALHQLFGVQWTPQSIDLTLPSHISPHSVKKMVSIQGGVAPASNAWGVPG